MIPEEIIKFMRNGERRSIVIKGEQGGKRMIVNLGTPTKSLLIKGDPGSGKTTLSLELLNYFRKDMAVFYLSSRVPDHVLIQQFPWVSRMLHLKLEKKERRIRRDNLRKLEGFIEGIAQENVVEGENEVAIEIGEIFPELEKIYDFIESQRDRIPLICIDSLDGLAEKYGVSPEKIMMTLQKDIVENHLGNIVFVLEASSLVNIDYLADGIILLKHDPSEGFWRRIMYILKLRGHPISKPKYVYTLHDGHFSVIQYHGFSMDNIKSLDIEEFEKEIKNYSDYPSINIRISPDVPAEIVQILLMALIKSSENSLILPPPSYPGEILRSHATKFIGKNVKILGHAHERGDLYLEGKDMFVEMSPEILKYYGGEKSTIILSVDSLNNVYRDVQRLPELIKDMKFEHRMFFITPEKFELNGADREIKIVMVEDIPVLVGERVRAIQPELENGNLKMKLIPLA